MTDRAITAAPAEVDAADHEAHSRANVRAMLAEAGTARLLSVAGRPDLAEPVTRSGARRLRRVLAGAGMAVVAAVAPVGAPQAQALAAAPTAVRVVLSGPTATVPLVLVSDRPATARGRFGVQVARPAPGGRVVTGEAWSDDPAILATMPARSADLVLGAQQWMVTDFGDGSVSGLPVTVLRASRVTVQAVVPLGVARVAAAVRVEHYGPATGGFLPSQQSPVQVQVLRGGRWATVATWTTDTLGTAAGVVTLPLGSQRIRFLRPDGATVATAASSGRLVTVS